MIILLLKTEVILVEKIFKKKLIINLNTMLLLFLLFLFYLFSVLFLTKFTNKFDLNESTGGEPEYKLIRKRMLSKKLFLIL
jgi:hypothetical protein